MEKKINKRDNLNKKDINKNIFTSIGIPAHYSSKIVDDVILILISNLKLNKNIKIKNFGSFMLRKKNKRIGRNPKNNETYKISERIVTTFKVSDALKLRINENASK